MIDNEQTKSIYATFLLRGKDLNPQEITDKLGIEPSWSFRRGDIHGVNKIWPHGYWEFSSKEFIQSSEMENHLDWLVEKLETSKDFLLKFIKQGNIDAVVSCFWIFPTSHESLTLQPEMMVRLASLGVKVEIDMYCPD